MPQQRLRDKRSHKIFIVIVLIAFYLRLQGISFNLPFIFNSEESNLVIRTVSLFRNFIQYFLSSDSSVGSPLFLLLNSILLTLKLQTLNANNLLGLLELDPGAVYVGLRFISVLFGVGSVIVVYLLGLRFSPLVALIASGILSVSMLHVKVSQTLTPINAVVFFCLLSSLCLVKKDVKQKDIALSAIFALIGFLMHPIGILSAIPLLFNRLANKSNFKYGPLFIKGFLIAFILSFNYILHLPSTLMLFVKQYIFNYYEYNSGSFLLYAFKFLLIGIGPVAYFCSIWLLKYKKDYDLNLLKTLFSLPLISIGILGLLHFTESKYETLIIPYFCIAGGLVLNSFYERAKTDNRKFAFILLSLLVFWIPLKYTFKYNKIMSLSDTRKEATEWIRQNTSEDYKIIWDKNSVQPDWHNAYDKGILKRLVSDPALIINKQRYIISSKLLSDKNWFKLLKKKADYALINSIDYEEVFKQSGHSPEKKFYRKILKQEPLIVFNPYLKDLDKKTGSLLFEDLSSPLLTLWQRERSGPVIKVYKL